MNCYGFGHGSAAEPGRIHQLNGYLHRRPSEYLSSNIFHRLRGYGRAGTQNDRLREAVILSTGLRGGHFEYRRAHTRAVDMPSAMPR